MLSGGTPAGRDTPGRTLTLTTNPMPSSRVAPAPANHGSFPNWATIAFLTCLASERLLIAGGRSFDDGADVGFDLFGGDLVDLAPEMGMLGHHPVIRLLTAGHGAAFGELEKSHLSRAAGEFDPH